MLKRVNKITALLVAATTVMSAIPVMASEKNLTPRLGELDGGITNAVAYKDGKYIFEGSKPDEDYGVYYNDGTKDTKLDDVSSLNDVKSRGLSSVVIPDGNNKEKIIDLADGKEDTDGDTDDQATDARVKLENKLSKTNKYGDNVKIDPKDFIEVPSNGFSTDGNTWYQYKAEGNKSYYNDINDEVDPNAPVEEEKTIIKVTCDGYWGGITIAGLSFSPNWTPDELLDLGVQLKNAAYTGYTLKSVIATSNGNYGGHVEAYFATSKELTTVPDGFTNANGSGNLAASIYTGTVPAMPKDGILYYGYCDKDGNYIDCSKIANISVFNGESIVKLDNFNDKKVADDVKVKVGLPTIKKTLGQDQNYIFNLIEVPVTGYQDVNDVKKKSDAVTNLEYIQKITKAQGDKDGGAYVPHDVKSYLITGMRSNGQLVWSGGDNWGYSAAHNIFNNSTDNMKVQVNGNVLYVGDTTDYYDGNGIRAISARIKLKTGLIIARNEDQLSVDKIDIKNLTTRKSLAQPMVFEDCSTSSDPLGDENDTDHTVTKTDDGAWATDYVGNVWTIHNGKIQMSGQGGTFEDKYKCEGRMNRLSVYDENNLIAWEDGGDTYVTVKDGQVASHKVTKTGWQQAEDGTWHLYDLKGNDSKGWVNVKSCTYYFDDKGAMKTGWADIDGKTYYFLASGVRATGWTKVGTEWYYLDASGVKQVSTTIDGYKLNSTGVRVN